MRLLAKVGLSLGQKLRHAVAGGAGYLYNAKTLLGYDAIVVFAKLLLQMVEVLPLRALAPSGYQLGNIEKTLGLLSPGVKIGILPRVYRFFLSFVGNMLGFFQALGSRRPWERPVCMVQDVADGGLKDLARLF